VKIKLLTDAPVHNLALMKISTYFKQQGDEVFIGKPMDFADLTYASWLFSNGQKYPADIVGGPGINFQRLPSEIEMCRPDYGLFPVDYSLGYTWEYCPRSCGFCVVPKFPVKKKHHSIWDFHDSRFHKICLLNNNTFSDPKWRETFEEIWDANLLVKDENGYDLRLMDEAKADALAKTKFEKQIHFAWDRMEDERAILRGLELAQQFSLNAMVYVLMGYDTTFEEDLYRCQKIHDFGFDPFPMLYKQAPALRRFRRFIYLRYYRRYPTLEAAWSDYGANQLRLREVMPSG